MTQGIHEIVKKVAAATTLDDKVAILRQNYKPALAMLLSYAYDPRIKWVLPEGDPPFKPLPMDQQLGSEMMLLKEARTMYLFVEGGPESNPNVKPIKRQQLFIDLLESVHPDDAKLILMAKNRSIPIIPRELVHAAYPGLLPQESVVEKAVQTVTAAVDTVSNAVSSVQKVFKMSEEQRIKKRERDRRARERERARRAEQQATAQTMPVDVPPTDVPTTGE